jgi:hypothetical protein
MELKVKKERYDAQDTIEWHIYTKVDNTFMPILSDNNECYLSNIFFTLEKSINEYKIYLIKTTNKKLFLRRRSDLVIWEIDSNTKEILGLLSRLETIIKNLSISTKDSNVKEQLYYEYFARIESLNIMTKLKKRRYKELVKDLNKFIITEKLVEGNNE